MGCIVLVTVGGGIDMTPTFTDGFVNVAPVCDLLFKHETQV